MARKLKSTVSAILVLSTIFPTNRKDFVSERYITLMLDSRLIPWPELIVQKQGPRQLKEVYNYDCFATAPRAIKTSCVDTDSSNNDLVFRCHSDDVAWNSLL